MTGAFGSAWMLAATILAIHGNDFESLKLALRGLRSSAV
jgi:hypothetical protein